MHEPEPDKSMSLFEYSDSGLSSKGAKSRLTPCRGVGSDKPQIRKQL